MEYEIGDTVNISFDWAIKHYGQLTAPMKIFHDKKGKVCAKYTLDDGTQGYDVAIDGNTFGAFTDKDLERVDDVQV